MRLQDVFGLPLMEATADREFRAAVGIVKYRNSYLLGLATASDDRKHRWVFPGGGIKNNESPIAAAVRETREETGVHCRAVIDDPEDIIVLSNNKRVAFVPCRASSDKVKPNHEFVVVSFFEEPEFAGLKLYHNVKELISKARKYF